MSDELHTAPGLPDAQTVAVNRDKGKVILLFATPCQWVALDPTTAFMVAEQIARQCYAIHNGREAPPDHQVMHKAMKSKVTEELRTILVNRVMLMMKSLDEQHRSPQHRAEAVVDAVLAKVE